MHSKACMTVISPHLIVARFPYLQLLHMSKKLRRFISEQMNMLLVGIWNAHMISELIRSDTQNTKWGNSQNL